MGEDERVEKGISRRSALKRIGAAGAIAWATPIISSLNTPAQAASPPSGGCSQCSGDFCFGQTICGNSGPLGVCGCAQVVGGNGECFCYSDHLCVDQTPCPNGQGDCPGGQVCVHTCCDSSVGSPVCMPACGTPERLGRLGATSGATGTGTSGMPR